MNGAPRVWEGLDVGHPVCMTWGTSIDGPFGFDFDGSGFAGGVVVEAAPSIVFRTVDESAGYRIAVDVTDLLDEFARCESVEVVVAGLPEVFACAFEEFGGFAFKTLRKEARVPVSGSP